EDPEKNNISKKVKLLRKLEELELMKRRNEAITANLEGGVPTDEKEEEEEDLNTPRTPITPKVATLDSPGEDQTHSYQAPSLQTVDIDEYLDKWKKDENLLYSPFDLFTRQRKVTQIYILQSIIRKLKIEFNN